MANHGCINGTLDDVNYSSPVPIIGLYIAAASSLCLLLMLYDIVVAGLIVRKRWLPCEWFTLNSVTLALLAVVAKIPVDLTTSMPTSRDQLSKLSGTVTICISMGFLLPSLGVNSDSECFTNMVALTIFVITVAVNICLQLHTGAIVLFFVEHIIILCLMLLLLLMLWHASRHIKSHKRITGDQYNNLITKGTASMFDRLRLSYLYSYCSNPQYQISMHPVNAVVSTVCLICSIVLIQATFRSLLNKVEFCRGTSDYSWSIPFIVISQILTVVVGTLAVMFRWIVLFSLMELESLLVSFQDEEDHVMQMNKTLRKGWLTLHRLQRSISSLSLKVILIAQLLLVSPAGLVRYFLQLLRIYEHKRLESFSDLNPGDVLGVTGYIARKSVDDILRLRKHVCMSESLNHLMHLFSNIYPSQQLHDRQIKIELPSHSIGILVKIAEVSMPKELVVSLLHSYSEVSEIIHFIDETLQPKSKKNEELSYAKVVWKGGDFTCLLPKDIIKMRLGLDRASATITSLKGILQSGDIWAPVGLIVDLINPKSHETIEDLYKSIEQLFVDMLHVSFGQLPIAIYRSLTESPAEEFEERVRLAMKFILKVGSLEHIHWSRPPASNIQSFVSNAEAHSDRPRRFTGPLTGLEDVVPISLDLDFMDREPRGRHSCWNF